MESKQTQDGEERETQRVSRAKARRLPGQEECTCTGVKTVFPDAGRSYRDGRERQCVPSRDSSAGDCRLKKAGFCSRFSPLAEVVNVYQV